MKLQVMNVTPAKAAGWLKMNTINRPVRKQHVARLAQAMKRGEWVANHQAIALNGSKLIDGQHRLMAVIESGLSFVEMSVIADADTKHFDTIDIGVKRSNADIFREDMHVMMPINFVASLTIGKSATPHQIQPIYSKLHSQVRELVNSAPRTVKKFCSPVIRAAAIAAILKGEDKAYVFDIYKNMCEYNIDQLPKVAQLFVRQLTIDSVVGNSKKIHGKDTYDLLARAWTVFQKDNANLQKLSVKKAADKVGEVREVFRSALGL